MFRVRQIFERRKDEFAESTKSARGQTREGRKNRGITFRRGRSECKSDPVFTRNIERRGRYRHDVPILRVFLSFRFLFLFFLRRVA